MAGLTLANYRTKLLLDLDASATEFPTANIDRAVQRAVQDLSRIMPNEDILDISINDLDITDEAFTTHGSAGTHISLANSPLQPGGERVYKATDDGTTYQRGTDYEIDYDAGTIAHLAGGDLSNSTAYSIDYDKSRRSISLSSIATGFISIRRVEYLAGHSVQQWRSFLLWGNELFITSPQQDVQRNLTENSNILIYYTKEWTPPLAGSEGDFPDHLDEVITKGALSYLLEARSYGRFVQAQAEVVLADAEFALANAANDKASAETTLSNTQVDSAVSLLSGILASGAQPHVDFTAQVVLVRAALSQADTVGDNIAVQSEWTVALTYAKAALDDIDLEEAGEAGALLTAISFTDVEAALDLAAAELAVVNPSLDSADAAFADPGSPTDTNTELDLQDEHLVRARAAIVNSVKYLDGTPSSGASADDQLNAGDALINTLNKGENVAAEYRNYALAEIEIARGFLQGAQAEMDALQGSSQLVQNRANVWLNKLQVNQIRIQEAQAIIQEAAERQDYNQIRIDGARAINEQEQLKMQEAQGYLNEAAERIKLATLQVEQMRGYNEQAIGGVGVMNAMIAEMNVYLENLIQIQ